MGRVTEDDWDFYLRFEEDGEEIEALAYYYHGNGVWDCIHPRTGEHMKKRADNVDLRFLKR